MAKSELLFSLIKAMTKAEKRYFKLYASLNGLDGEKDYVRLFDAIEAQEIYDEKAILDKFKGEPYFRHLKAIKYYLYKQIIRSLKSLHDDSSSTLKLQNYFIEMDILYKKGLFKNCAATIKKARELAQKLESFPKLLEILSWESKLATWMHDVDRIEAMKLEWNEEEQNILNKYTEVYELKKLNHDIQSFIITKAYAKTEDEVRFIENILNSELLKHEKKSFVAEINRISIVANCMATLGRREERYVILKRMIDFYFQHPAHMELRKNETFYNMHSVANLALSLNKIADTGLLIAKMHSIYDVDYERIELKNKIAFLTLQSHYLLTQGKFEEALEVINETDNLNVTNNREMSLMEKITLYEVKFSVNFCNGAFKEAQHYIREIINLDTDFRLDLQIRARIAYLIIQFEEKEFSHLEYAWRSTYRYLMKKERLQEGEMMLLHFLKKTGKLNSERQVLLALAEFKEQIAPYLDQILAEFPLIEWIDSKIQNKSLQEVIKQNYSEMIANEQC